MFPLKINYELMNQIKLAYINVFSLERLKPERFTVKVVLLHNGISRRLHNPLIIAFYFQKIIQNVLIYTVSSRIISGNMLRNDIVTEIKENPLYRDML